MVKQKAFFIIFNEFLVAKNCLRPENAPLKLVRLRSLASRGTHVIENCSLLIMEYWIGWATSLCRGFLFEFGVIREVSLPVVIT